MTGATGLHLAQPAWLWLLLLPLPLWWLPRLRRAAVDRERLNRYADEHLLPHLYKGMQAPGTVRRQLLYWSLLWVLGVLAMAGPRFGYTDVDLYGPSASLVILLDLSRSMDVADVKPSRLARARQEIEDLLDAGDGLRVGLIAFASVSHVVAPITEDGETLRHLLPSLSTDLVRWPGSRLANALERARQLLTGQPDTNSRAILLISDGDIPEEGLEEQARMLREFGITLHVIGLGTPEGAPVPGPDGRWVTARDGSQVLSRLEEGRLERLANAGGGLYRRADFLDDDTAAVLERVRDAGSAGVATGGSQRIWNERYYLPAGLLMLLVLDWLRRTGGRRRSKAKT